MPIFLLALSAISLAGAGPGTCVRFSGEYILARDVALVFPPFRQLAPEMRVARAPNPGSFRTLSARDLRHASLAYPELLIPEQFQACFEWEVHQLRAEDLVETMMAALDRREARIEVVDHGPKAVPSGKLVFSRSNLIPPALTSKDSLATWRGYVEYGPSLREPVWARVRVRVPVQRVVSTMMLRALEEISASQVRLETTEEFPAANPERVEKLEDVVGMSLRRSVGMSMPIQRTLLTSPRIVAKGETVELRVVNGSTLLKLEVRAETSGAQGEFVLFRNSANGKLIRAQIQAPGLAVLNLARPNSMPGDR